MNELQSILEDLSYIESPQNIDETIEMLEIEDNTNSKINESALSHFTDLINSNEIDGIGVTEYACREIIKVFDKKISYRDKSLFAS